MFDPSYLPHGIYRIHWLDSAGGGSSVAAVGATRAGKHWFACANFTHADEIHPHVASTNWEQVDYVELITTQ